MAALARLAVTAVTATAASAMKAAAKVSFARSHQMLIDVDHSWETSLATIEASLVSLHGQVPSELAFAMLNITNSSMKKGLLQRAAATQKELDTLSDSFAECLHPADASRPGVAALNDSHWDCRQVERPLRLAYNARCIEGENAVWRAHNAACLEYKNAQAEIPDPRDLCQMPHEVARPKLGNYLHYARDFFKAKLDHIKKQEQRCNDTRPSEEEQELCREMECKYFDKRLECDRAQESFEREACQEHRKYSCQKYEECFRSKHSVAEATLAAAKEAASTYAHEWEMVLRIECFVHAITMQDEAVVERELQHCREKHVATDAVKISLPGPMPLPRPCDFSHLKVWQPGSPEFRSRWYSALPGEAGAVPCASACCLDTTFIPAYPADAQHCPYVATTTTSTTTSTARPVARGFIFQLFGTMRMPR